MKSVWLTLLFASAASPGLAQTNVYSANIVGYVNLRFFPGHTLFGNPLDAPTNNLLSSVIPQAPLGTTVSLWNTPAHQFLTTSTFQTNGWSLDFSLPPGQGALLHTASPFTNTFVGSGLAPDGSPYNDLDPNPSPPPPPPAATPAWCWFDFTA